MFRIEMECRAAIILITKALQWEASERRAMIDKLDASTLLIFHHKTR
jgi:hypothetical protein